jgi:hypothetical protein
VGSWRSVLGTRQVSRCYTISSQQLPTVAACPLHPARSDVRPRPNQLAQARVAARGGEEERGGEDGAFPFGGGGAGIGGAAFRGTRGCVFAGRRRRVARGGSRGRRTGRGKGEVEVDEVAVAGVEVVEEGEGEPRSSLRQIRPSAGLPRPQHTQAPTARGGVCAAS